MTRTAHRKPPPDHAVSWIFLRSFTGKERDEETGYSYFGARYMDHELMTMWLSVDPLADKYPSFSPYAYCAWNPVKLVDPNGEEAVILGGASANVALPQSADKQWTMLSIGFSLSVGPQFGVGVSAGAQVGGTKPLAPEIPTHPRTFVDRFLNKYTHESSYPWIKILIIC